MPQANRNVRRRVFRLAFFSLATWGFLALGRGRNSEPEPVRYRPVDEGDSLPGWASTPAPSARRKRTPTRRLAASFAFAVLFFAGASFSAVAGDALVTALESDGPSLAAEDTAAVEEEAAAEEAVAEEPAAEEVVAEEPVAEEPAAPVEAEAPAPEAAPAEAAPSFVPDGEAVVEAAPADAAPAAEAEAAPAESAEPAVEAASDEVVEAAPVAKGVRAFKPKAKAPAPVRKHVPLDPEVTEPGMAATIWLNRTAPDPTPAALRLAPEFAAKLRREARRAGVDWALVLGVLRAEGARGRVPARQATIREASGQLAALDGNTWNVALEYTGRTAGADRAQALARYYRAVGMKALVNGLVAEKDNLVAKILADPRVDIYAAGRDDLASGKIDVRVVALIAYLAEAYGQVTVSSLFSGHRLYARPGVVSAHIYGQAVDIAALGGMSIIGHQQPGSVTEKAVRDILLLPTEMRPRQVISLIGMGGPSFPMADHADHIHVGF